MRSGPPLAHASTVMLPPVTGRLIGGKYELLRKLGEGSMGEVWVAVHRTLGEEVAIKLLTRRQELAQLEGAEKAAARFRFEAQVAARLSRNSAHVVRVTDHGEEGPLAYIVMELLEGQSLEARLLRRGPMEPALVVACLRQIASALDRAHAEGVVHRDLKPANVFLVRAADGGPHVKLLDFGIARAVGPEREASPFATASNVVLGTPGYMSPEHAEGGTPPDHHCDLWALATVAYEALTGELPVPGLHAEEVIANVRDRKIVPILQRDASLPAALDGFFERAFALRVEERFRTASDLVAAFERAVAGPPRSDAPTAFVQGSGPSTKGVLRADAGARPRWGRALLAAACVALLAAAVAGALAYRMSARAVPSVAACPGPPPAAASVPAPLSLEPLPAAVQTTTPAAGEPEARSPTGDCAVPYEYDRSGIKRWKRQCL